jgi:SAM-dependent methyltransferase
MEAQQAEVIGTTRRGALACPACGGAQVRSFYKVANVPVNSCVLMRSAEEARAYPRGRIDLTFCDDCGFIFNQAFDPKLIEYSERYEETQGYSETFNAFHRALADKLIERYDLRGKRVIEIGCGKGEFLTLLSDLGENTGIGFDPTYVADRSRAAKSDRVTFVNDFYAERYAQLAADFVCCKMTLEHIPAVEQFISLVRHATERNPGAVVFFQVPEVGLILDQLGFWDIYYEHCSYFTPASLRALFERCGFDVRDVWVDYGDQYLMIEAVRAVQPARTAADAGEVSALAGKVARFAEAVADVRAEWKARLGEWAGRGEKVVLWGSGSKAVSFLTTLGITRELQYVVDINPHRQGMFMPGTGHAIGSPDFLVEYKPDRVVVMNPIYREEIATMLKVRGVEPMISTVVDAD